MFITVCLLRGGRIFDDSLRFFAIGPHAKSCACIIINLSPCHLAGFQKIPFFHMYARFIATGHRWKKQWVYHQVNKGMVGKGVGWLASVLASDCLGSLRCSVAAVAARACCDGLQIADLLDACLVPGCWSVCASHFPLVGCV